MYKTGTFVKISHKSFTVKAKTSWQSEYTIYGQQVLLENSNFKKKAGVKLYESFRLYKFLKVPFTTQKLPLLLKFLIGFEFGTWFYSSFMRSYVYDRYNQYERYYSSSFLYTLMYKESLKDYVLNFAIYLSLGKTLYLTERKTYLLVLGLGLATSYAMLNLDGKLSTVVDKEFNVEEFSLFPNSVNIIPKLILSYSIVKYLNYFLVDKEKLIKGVFTYNRKYFTMFALLFVIAKISRQIAYFTSDSINLGNVEGVTSLMMATLLIRRHFLKYFFMLYYFNPYTLIVWFGVKNNLDEAQLSQIYSNKNYLEKFKTYLTFTTLLSFSNMLNVYF